MASLVLFLILLADPPAQAQAAGGAATKATAPAAPAESRTIVGEIVWVDLTARLVLIRESVKTTKVKGQPPARQTVAVSVAPDVAMTRGKRTASLEDLRAKDHVTARYVTTSEGAKALSFRVAEIAPPAPAGASAAADGVAAPGSN